MVQSKEDLNVMYKKISHIINYNDNSKKEITRFREDYGLLFAKKIINSQPILKALL